MKSWERESDLKVVGDDEFGVAHVEGVTEAGRWFVDGYLDPVFPDLVAVDSGRIIIWWDAVPRLLDRALERGLEAERG